MAACPELSRAISAGTIESMPSVARRWQRACSTEASEAYRYQGAPSKPLLSVPCYIALRLPFFPGVCMCRQTRVLELLDTPGALPLWEHAPAPTAARAYYSLPVGFGPA